LPQTYRRFLQLNQKRPLPQRTAENLRKCVDEKKATVVKQLLYFD
jgi:hypothetical protein